MTYWCPRLPGRRSTRAARNSRAWLTCAHRTSTSRCARSAWPRSPPSAARRCRSRSRSTRRRDGPSLYEYRPLVRGFVEEQAPTLRRLPDARNAIDDLRREPAAAIFARAHAGLVGDRTTTRSSARSSLPMLTWTAERCGGFDWHDEAFDVGVRRSRADAVRHARAPTSRSRRSSGSRPAHDADLGGGHHASPDRRRRDLAALARGAGPDAAGVRPRRRPAARARAAARARRRRGRAAGRGRRARRRRHGAPARDRRRDRRRPGRLRAPRLPPACASRRCCRSRRRSRAARRRGSTRFARSSPPICASGCRSPTRIASSARRSTAGSCRSSPRSRSAPRRCARRSRACSAATAALWAAVACARPSCSPRRRTSAASSLDGLRAERLDRDARDAVRRALVEALLHGSRVELVEALDETLLGLRPRPRVRAARRLSARRARSVTESAQTRHVLRRLPSVHGRRRARLLRALEADRGG